MEQTAVELLIEQIKSKADSLPYNTKENRIAKGIYVDCLMMAKQAKEMEKQQIIDAFAECWKANMPDGFECKLSAKEYYEESFKQD